MTLENEVDDLLDAAIAAGLLEEVGGDLRATRRWKREIQAASLELTREAEACPTCPRPTDPVGECVRRALPRFDVAIEGDRREALMALLANFEIATMTPAKRQQNGYAAHWPPTSRP